MADTYSESILKILVLAAASDGVTDTDEHKFLNFIVDSHPIFEGLDKDSKKRATNQMLISTARQTEQEIVRELINGMDQHTKIFTYAMALDVCFCNNQFIPPESDFMEYLASAMELDEDALKPFHTSAKVRYLA